MTRPCPQPAMTVHLNLTDVVAGIAHGVRHMSPADLAVRAVLALACLGTAAWMIHRGEVAWPLLVGAAGALSVAVDAVELYAVAAVCDRLAQQEGDR